MIDPTGEFGVIIAIVAGSAILTGIDFLHEQITYRPLLVSTNKLLSDQINTLSRLSNELNNPCISSKEKDNIREIMLNLGNQMESTTKIIADLSNKIIWSGLNKVYIPDAIPPIF